MQCQPQIEKEQLVSVEFAAGAWTITVVDSALGSTDPYNDTYASLALGPAGIPGIAYYDAANGDLKFALCT